MTALVLEHCESDDCQHRPIGWSRNTAFFSAVHDSRGAHVYLGPCCCECDACKAAPDSHVTRLNGDYAPLTPDPG